MIYLLDANSFIEAKNLHYRMQVVPGFWDWLLAAHENITIQSIESVYAELTKSTTNQDELHFWAKDNKGVFIQTSDPNIQGKFAEIANYVSQHALYSKTEVARFLAGADPWLIAAAKAWGGAVVTHEVLAPANSTKVKIPNIAKAFEVEYMNIFDLLEHSACKLVLK